MDHLAITLGSGARLDDVFARFQRAEFLVEHGMVDAIVARKDLKPYISTALRLLLK